MSLKTVSVQVELHGPNAGALFNVPVVATLSAYELDGGVVVPTQVRALTNRLGIAVLNLWPNARGQHGTHYQVTAEVAGDAGLDLTIVVPDAAVGVLVPIRSLISLAPYPTVDASQQALLTAQAQTVAATAQAQAAALSSSQAATSLTAAQALSVTVTAAYVASINNVQELRTLFLNYIASHP